MVGAVTTGPNHALHFVLTLLTFWACGGWAWIWLLIALFSKRRVHAVDEYGRLVQPQRAPGAASEVLASVGGALDRWVTREDESVDPTRMGIVIAGIVVVVLAGLLAFGAVIA